MKNNEYAPQYTCKEVIKLHLLYILYSIPIILFVCSFYWLSLRSWFKCSSYGRHIFYYGEFVGIYLIFGVISLFFWIRNDYPLIQLKQYPLPHKKVIHKTKYKYGWQAVLFVIAKLLIYLLFFIVSIWGYFQVTMIIEHNINVIEVQEDIPPVCNPAHKV